MTQEDKELLIKDLCARLQYGVKAHYKYYDFVGGTEQLVSEDDAIITGVNTTLGNPIQVDGYYVEVEYVKPYLRPMSNMAEEERNEWTSLMRKEYREAYPNSAIDTSYYEYFPTPESFDYLIENMFDYRGLIPKGLALEAPEGMYK